MREEWKNFWLQWARHLWRLPIGLLIALVFFLIAMPQWHRSDGLLTGLMISAVYGVVIPITVALCFAAAYAARLQISIKTGRVFKVSMPVNILINVVGLAMGLQLGMRITHAAFGAMAAGGHFLTSMVFGGGVIVVFSFYFAYKQAKEETLALRAEAAEARYHALENRMRPHFLFNALNSLAELIELGRENAAETAYKLSDPGEFRAEDGVARFRDRDRPLVPGIGTTPIRPAAQLQYRVSGKQPGDLSSKPYATNTGRKRRQTRHRAVYRRRTHRRRNHGRGERDTAQ
jgi:hypothetical protein